MYKLLIVVCKKECNRGIENLTKGVILAEAAAWIVSSTMLSN